MTTAHATRSLGERFDHFGVFDADQLTDLAIADLALSDEQADVLRTSIRSSASTWLDGLRRLAERRYFDARKASRAAQGPRRVSKTQDQVLSTRRALYRQQLFNGTEHVTFFDATVDDLQGAIMYTEIQHIAPLQEKVVEYQQMIDDIIAAGVQTWGQVP